MTKKSNKSELIRRRAAMKTLLAGGGAIVSGISLPRNCSEPIVDAVVLPAHAQTSLLMCGCALFNLGVNFLTNTFTAQYSWSDCANIDQTRLIITGPGVVNTLGQVQPTSDLSGSRLDLVDLSSFNATVFQPDSTYTFTLTVEDDGSTVLQTCVDTVTTPGPIG